MAETKVVVSGENVSTSQAGQETTANANDVSAGKIGSDLLKDAHSAQEGNGVSSARAYRDGKHSDDYRFPRNLASDKPVITFIAQNWKEMKNKSSNSSMKYNKQQTGSVALYLPSFNESLNISWESELTPKAMAINTLRDALSGTVPGFAIGKAYLQQTHGVSVSQDSIATFKDIENKKYSFSFDLFPTSRADSEAIIAIIEFFKNNSLPVFGEFLVGFPCVFEVTILNAGNKNGYFKLKPMALTGINITYGDGSNGVMKLMSDGAPSNVKLDLEFQEIHKWYRNT